MNRSLAAGLVVLTVGAVGFGAAQYFDARKLRADVAALDRERAELRKKLWDMERRSRAPAAVPATATAATTDSEEKPAGADAEEGRRAFRGNFAERAGRAMAVMDTPEMQRLMSLQQKGALDGRYAALFRKLNLNPQQLEQLKNLLVEKQTAPMDVMAAAREQGIDPFQNGAEFRQLIQNAQDDIDNNIRANLGENVYNQYKDYENTFGQRSLVTQLQDRLSYSNTPLSSQQAEQLIGILAASSPSTASRNAVFLGGPGGMGGAVRFFGANGTPVTDDAIASASTILTADQISALREIQSEQQAQTQIGNQMRATWGGGSGGRGNRGG